MARRGPVPGAETRIRISTSSLTPWVLQQPQPRRHQVTQNLEAELKRLDDEITEISNRLKAKKRARRKLAGALEQLRLTI